MQMQLRKMMISVVLLAVFVMCVRAQPPQAQGIERTRTFTAQKCQYTLPNDDWEWIDQPLPNALFGAKCENGLGVFLSCAPIPAWQQMNASLAQKFEQSVNQATSGQFKKRGEGYISYQGLSCYQLAGVYPDGSTAISRCFLAHGFAYNLLIIGNSKPVEQDAEFDKAINGFAFTEPPPAKPTSGYSFFDLNVFLVLLAVCFVAAILRRTLGSSKKPPLQHPIDNFDDELSEVVPVRPSGYQPSSIQATRPSSLGYSVFERHDSNGGGPQQSRVRPESDPRAGKCRHYGYRPVAFGAQVCLRCGGSDPNPGIISKCAGRGGLGGALLGTVIGASWGYMSFVHGGIAGAFAGGLVGALAGVILGLAMGLAGGLTARISGWR
jgi:hypothetical protein